MGNSIEQLLHLPWASFTMRERESFIYYEQLHLPCPRDGKERETERLSEGEIEREIERDQGG